MSPPTLASENGFALDDVNATLNGLSSDYYTANNSLPLCMLSDPTLQDDTAIVKGGPSGPSAQSVTAGSVHSSIVAERSESTVLFSKSSNDRSHMQDVPVEQSSYFDQWIRVTSVHWNNSTDDQFHTFSILSNLLNTRRGKNSSEFAANNPALNLLNSSAFVSWDSLDAYVTVSSPPNVSGLAILTALPRSLYPSHLRFGSGNNFFKGQLEVDKVRAFNMPHVKISYTESNSAILNIPWNFDYASVSTTSSRCIPNDILKLALYSFVTPNCGAGSSSDVTLTLFVKFNGLRGEGKRPLNVSMTQDPSYAYASLQDDDDEFDVRHSTAYADLCNLDSFKIVYDFEHYGPPHMRTWSAVAHVTYNGVKTSFESPRCFTKQQAKQEIIMKVVSQFGSLQDLTSILGTVSNIAGTVADLTNPIKLTSTIGSLVSGGVSKLLGGVTLDAPWAPPSVETRVIPVNVDNFPGGVGPRKVVVMDIDDSHHESPLEGITYDDPDMRDSLTRPGLLFTLDIPVNSAPGVLFHIPCSVIDGCVSFDGVSDLTSGVFKPTPAGLAASLYQYVQGTKIYDFMLVKSVMQTVTLNFAFNPTFPPTSIGHAMAGRSETVTFQEDVAKSIECPIISPWRLFPHNLPRLMLKGETGEPVSGFGYLTVTLVNPITSNALCASTIKLVVSSKFAPNVKLFCPRVSNVTTAFSGPVSTNTPTLQDEVVDVDDEVPVDDCSDDVEFLEDVNVDVVHPRECWCQTCTDEFVMECEDESLDVDMESVEDCEMDVDEDVEEEVMDVSECMCCLRKCTLQDDVTESDVGENYENGTSIAPPAVTTQRIVRTLDGFGASPSLKDSARRFDDYFTFKGKLAAETEGTVRLFVIPISAIPGKTVAPDSTTFQISSPNAFQTLSLTHAYFGGGLDLNLSITGIPNGTATARYVNGTPMFSYVNTTTPLRTAKFNANWHILDVVSPLSPPAYVDQIIRDYTGMRAKEKRSLETNNQITLGLPNHTEFSAISTVPLEMGSEEIPATSVDNFLWLTRARTTVMGTLIISIEVPNGQSVEGSLVVDLRAADSAHWSWPTGTPLCGTAIGASQPVMYVFNLLECPNELFDDGSHVYVDANSAVQYFSRPVGGSLGVKLYPLAAGVSAAVKRKKLMESGDIETNPGPVMSTLGTGEVSQLSSATAYLKQWLNSASSGVGNTFKAVQNIPTVVNGISDSVPVVVQTAKSVQESADSVNVAASTMNDILSYVQMKIRKVFDIPIASLMTILHYIQLMLDARKKSITLSCFAGILFHLGLITFDVIAVMANKLIDLFKGNLQDGDTAPVGLRYFNILFSFILAGLGLVFTPLKKIPSELLNKTTAIFRNINCVDTFMKNNFDLISHGTTWYSAQKQKCELMLVNLGELQPEVELWLAKANAVISSENVLKLDAEVGRQKLLIECAKQGTDLFGKLAKLVVESPNNRPVVTVYNMVDKMLARVRTVYVDHVGKFLLTDKYSVPFCVWLYGEPGIGKSHIVPSFAADYLSAMCIPADQDPLYRRTAGAKFWDGLGTQPLLWLSDPEQDNSDEGITQFVRDWYEILSPIPFNPNMANVNEKGKCHKFLGTFVDSNSFFSNKRNLVLSESAFRSRRDVVAEIILCPRFVDHITRLQFEGRSRIEDFSSHVKIHPEDAFEGFEEFSHLRVRYSMNGNERPDAASEVSMKEFRQILLKKLMDLTTTRRLNSKAKSDLFASLSTENTAKKLAEYSTEKVQSIINTISSITGIDEAEKLAVATDLIKKNADVVVEGEYDGSLQDVTKDLSHVGDTFVDCCEILNCSPKCLHELLIKYNQEGTLNLSVLNNRPVVMLPPALVEVIMQEDFACVEPDVSSAFCYLPVVECNCSESVRNMSLMLNIDNIPEEFVDVYKSALNAVEVKLTAIVPPCPSVITKICAFLSLLAVVSAIVYLIVWICKKFCSSGKTQDYERMMKTTKPRAPGAKVLQVNPKLQDSEEVIMKGCGRFSCTYKENNLLKEVSTNMFSLGGNAWYLPGHTIIKLRKFKPESCTFTYKTHAGSPISQIVPWSECNTKYAFEVEHDVGVITHPRLQPVRKKVNLFANAQELSNISSNLSVYSWNNGVYSKTSVSRASVQIAHPDGHQQQLLVYYGFQGNGLCGSPVVDNISGKIVGFHNAGWPNGKGGATICGKSLVEHLLKESGALFSDVHDIETELVSSEYANDFCAVEKIVDPTFVGRISTKSSLQKSSLYGVLGEPEKVIPEGKLEDAFKCMEPYAKEPKILVLPDWIVDKAADEYANVIIKHAPPVSLFKPKPLSVQTALEGIPNLPFHLPPMRDTSAGLPLLNLGLPKKGQCFTETIDDKGRHITGLNPKFVSQYNEFSNELLSGCKPRSNAMLFLKDERKKPTKAIRGINGSDFVVHVMFLQYFLPFFAAYRKAKFHVGSAISCNIDNEAFEMFSYMGEVEPDMCYTKARYITADYKNFGPTIIHHFAGKIIDVIVKWYEKYGDVTPHDVLMMRRLFAVMLNSDHVVLNYWFRPQQGIFSGNPFTAEFNTFVNNLYIRAAWLYVCSADKQLAAVSGDDPFLIFREKVRIVTYGDDLVARTHSCLYSVFNNITIKSFMDLIGLEFTDALKRPTMVETDEFSKVSFLKRTFTPHPSRFDCLLAALDIGTIRDMICYVRGKGEIDQKSVVIAKDAVRFLHGHGPAVFDEMRSKIVSFCEESESEVLNDAEFMSWSQVDAQVFDVQDDFVRNVFG
uniref:Polyprotein n=1 Tax=Victoria bee virus 2 TaxID=2201322 RepID=A0A2U8JQB5_9VIRU|nr:polyprotein [Victoria bee virus 2]